MLVEEGRDKEAGARLREAGRDLIGIKGGSNSQSTASGGKGERSVLFLKRDHSLPQRSACSR